MDLDFYVAEDHYPNHRNQSPPNDDVELVQHYKKQLSEMDKILKNLSKYCVKLQDAQYDLERFYPVKSEIPLETDYNIYLVQLGSIIQEANALYYKYSAYIEERRKKKRQLLEQLGPA